MKLPAGVGKLKSEKVADAEVTAANDTPNLQHVIWYRDPGLRKLYALTAVIIISSATNGYDGYHPPF